MSTPRQQKRQQRRALGETARTRYSRDICETFLRSQTYQRAHRLAAYLPLKEEVDVRAIIDRAWADGKQLYLPVVIARGQALQFAPHSSLTPLTKDAIGIDIPDVPMSSYCTVSALDVVITPLVAFDAQCQRIGMGGGFYDRTFAQLYDHPADATSTQPQKVGVAFEVQRLAHIKRQTWDIALDSVISECQVYGQPIS